MMPAVDEWGYTYVWSCEITTDELQVLEVEAKLDGYKMVLAGPGPINGSWTFYFRKEIQG